MALTTEDLQAIAELISPINDRLNVMDQKMDIMQMDIEDLKTDVQEVKKNAEYTATVLEGALKIVDDLDQRYKAI